MDDELKKLFEESDRLEKERMLVTQELLATARERLYAEQRFNDILALVLELYTDGLEELADSMSKLESRQSLILGSVLHLSTPQEAANLFDDSRHRREHLLRVIGHHRRTLERLREKESIFGTDTPVAILNQIEICEQQIEDYQIELEKLVPD